MSLEINTYEMLDIQNESPDTELFAKALKDYLQQFNDLVSLQSLTINRLNLVVDDKYVHLAYLETEDHEGTYFNMLKTPAAYRQDQDHPTLWPLDTPMGKLIQLVPTAKHLHLELCFSIIRNFGPNYGYMYFSELFEQMGNLDQLFDYITYKCLEYYDQDDEVTSYRFEKQSGRELDGEPQLSDDISLVRDITDWFCNNFGFEIEIEESPEEHEEKEFLQKTQEFLATFGEYLYADGEDLSFYAVNGSLEFPSSQMESLTSFLQYAYDFVRTHHGEFNLTADFTPGVQYEFARLKFAVEGERVVAKAARF